MTEKGKQQAINKAAWNKFEKTGDFSALLDIRFIISDNVKKELKENGKIKSGTKSR